MHPYLAMAMAQRRCGRRCVLGLAALAVVVAAAAMLPERLRRAAEHTVARLGGGAAEVTAMSFDPWRLALRLDGVRLTDPGGAPLLAVDKVTADLAFDSLWTRSVHFSAVSLTGIQGQLELLEGGGVAPRLPRGGTGGDPPRIRIDQLTLAGALVLSDARSRPEAALHLTELALSMTGFDSRATVPTPVTLRGGVGGGTLSLNGEITPMPFMLTGKFALQRLAAGPALAYLERALPLKTRGGRIDASGTLLLSAKDGLQVQGGQASLRGTELADAQDVPLAQVAELTLDGLGLEFATRRLSVGRISGSDNWLALTRDATGRLNLASLIEDRPIPTPGPPWHVTLGGLALTGQRVTVTDATVKPSLRQEITLDRLDIGALVLSDASAQSAAARPPDSIFSTTGLANRAPAPVTLRGRVDDGTLRLDGEITPVPFALKGKFELQRLAAGPALAYLEGALPVKARGGRIDASGTLSLSGENGLQVREGRVRARGTKLADAQGVPLAQAAELTLDGVALDLDTRRLTVDRISGRDNWLALTRDADGRLNLAGLIEDRPANTPGPPWHITLGALALTGQRVTVTDATVKPSLRQEITLDRLDIGALGRADKVPVSVAATLAQGGSLTLTGEAVLPSGPAELDITAKGLPLLPLAPYLPDVGPVQLLGGTAAANGRLTVGEPGPEYRGQVTLSRVELWDTERKETLLGLRTLRVDQMVASAKGVTSSKIWLNRPVLRVIIMQNRRSNLARFGPRNAAPVATSPVPEAPPGRTPMRLKVDTVRVNRGTLAIEDHSVTPHFAVSIQHLRGDVDGLSTDPTARARVALAGRIDQYAPASVEGSFTLTLPRNADFKLSLTGVEIATFAPYISRFAGYRIERGMLDVDLDYTVKGPRVRGRNRIVLDRLVLGERVDSEDALDVPLTLALAVLKNSRGVIDVDLPVSGDLSNPQFDYGALIGKALRRAIVKAATAPFTVLARLVGGKDADLQTVAFPPGTAQLPAVQLDKLEKLAQALIARPQLVLDIRPQADQDDGRALAVQALRVALGDTPGDEGANEDEFGNRLRALYRERFGSDPPPVIAPEGVTFSAEEQRAADVRAARARLMSAFAPGAEAMEALVTARGETIRAALTDNGVPAARLAVTLPADDAQLLPSAATVLALRAS